MSAAAEQTQPRWPAPGATVSWYEGRVNSDLSEGRGPMVEVATHTFDPETCFEAVRGKSTQGDDGDVIEVTLTVTDEFAIRRSTRMIYGSHYDWDRRRRVFSWREEFASLNDR